MQHDARDVLDKCVHKAYFFIENGWIISGPDVYAAACIAYIEPVCIAINFAFNSFIAKCRRRKGGQKVFASFSTDLSMTVKHGTVQFIHKAMQVCDTHVMYSRREHLFTHTSLRKSRNPRRNKHCY